MRRLVVMGLGITGRAVVESLLRRDIDVVALDDRLNDTHRSWAASLPVEVFAPGDIDMVETLQGADGLLPAPGLPDGHPIFAQASEANIPVMSEFDLAAAWDDRPAVAITGTDGKTTVVTLVQRMLDASGLRSQAVGNTDTPWVEAIEDPTTDVFVVEASSFRLAYSQRFAPQVAAWLNFGPDHLDAHADLATYEQAKASIWSNLDPTALALANRDDAVVARHANNLDHDRLATFGADAPPTANDHGIVDGTLIVGGRPLLAIDDLARSMPHDLLNALAASAIALAAGATREAAASVLRAFDGLEHRVEFVGELDGVSFINDSKATTPHASAAALGGFESIVLLAGGKNKGLAFDDMIAHADRITHVVALGEAAGDIEAVFAGLAPTTVATSMTDAVTQAFAAATPGDTVLLSPACASFDMYKNYVHRGEDFTRIVHELIAAAPTALLKEQTL